MRRTVAAALAAALAVAVLRHRARWPSRTAQARADGFSAGAVAERMRLTAGRTSVEVKRVDIGPDDTVTITGRLPLGAGHGWGAEYSVDYVWPSTGRTPFGRGGTVLGMSTPDDPTRVPTLAELRDQRGPAVGWNSGPMWKPGDDLEKEMDAVDSLDRWERSWPEPDRREDEGDGGASR